MSRSSGAIVEAYAGARYPERPLRVLWQGRWRNVGRGGAQEHRAGCRARNSPAPPPGRRRFLELISNMGGVNHPGVISFHFLTAVLLPKAAFDIVARGETH